MDLRFTEKDCLEAGVAEIIGEAELKAALRSGRRLRIKLGIDPTSPNIHIGRSLPIWRLRAFQELGHEIHLILGDFTGQVGDTSDKDAERPMLSSETVKRNLETYLQQLWLVLNPAKKSQVAFHYNSEWLSSLTLGKLSGMADAFSVNGFVKRELIARRLEEGSRVSLREMLYPLMQGYDSVMIKADVEIGGTDQRFNLLAGRVLQEQAGQAAQSIVMNHLIPGTDGRKMSSSWGNVIALMDSPEDKFGKVMASLDTVMRDYLQALPLSAQPFTQDEVKKFLNQGKNPRDMKLQLAWSLTALYHGEEAATEVQKEWISQFSENQKPAEIPQLSITELADEKTLPEALVRIGFARSKTEARRLIDQRGVRINDAVVDKPDAEFAAEAGMLIQVGKRNFLRLKE